MHLSYLGSMKENMFLTLKTPNDIEVLNRQNFKKLCGTFFYGWGSTA